MSEPAGTDTDAEHGPKSQVNALLAAVAAGLAGVAAGVLIAEIVRLERERKEELEERLRPFQTPVSEETMRRSVA